MKIYIVTDLEGVAGVYQWENREDQSLENMERRFRQGRWLAEEVNAMSDGLFAGGATEVWVNDGHGAGATMDLECLRPGVDVTVEEIIDTKDRTGVSGWLAAGKDATLKRPAVIEPFKADVPAFDLVIIGSPVWAWTVTPAVRTFCQAYGKTARDVAFFCTMGGSGDGGTFHAMKALCGKQALSTLALIDKHVKAADETRFGGKVKAFALSLSGKTLS